MIIRTGFIVLLLSTACGSDSAKSADGPTETPDAGVDAPVDAAIVSVCGVLQPMLPSHLVSIQLTRDSLSTNYVGSLVNTEAAQDNNIQLIFDHADPRFSEDWLAAGTHRITSPALRLEIVSFTDSETYTFDEAKGDVIVNADSVELRDVTLNARTLDGKPAPECKIKIKSLLLRNE